MRCDVGPEPRRKAVLEGLAASRITCSSSEALQFKDRYRIHRGAETATIDIFYDGSQRITGVESADASGSTRLLLDAIECVERLPGSILRPRFVDRIASPVLLIEAHTQALQEIDIDIVGLRLAQFQLRYDLIDRYDPTSATFQVSVHYDRRGRVTYRAGAVGQEVPDRILQAFRDNRGDESTETDASDH